MTCGLPILLLGAISLVGCASTGSPVADMPSWMGAGCQPAPRGPGPRPVMLGGLSVQKKQRVRREQFR